jgi:hypothetical protein
MSEPPPPGFWRWSERVFTIVMYSGVAGMGPGAISGTVIPLFGTVVGAGVGLLVGLGVSVVVVPLLVRRDLGRAFGLMVVWSMVFAGASVLCAWVCLFFGYDRYLTQVYMYAAVPGTVAVYVGGAVRAYVKHPVGWPRWAGSGCGRCGYSLAGLPNWICPECGTDNEPKRLAQPE